MNDTIRIEQKEHDHQNVNTHRKRLLEGVPVKEKMLELESIDTCILEGGEGTPVIFLHGPGESSIWWTLILPEMVKTHHVIVPDLPGHGSSKVLDGTLNPERVMSWLGKLIDETCNEPPILVGHVLGGSIAARFTVAYQEKVSRLVLVDSLGLGNFRPSLRFAFGLIRFMVNPSEKTYTKFLPQCMYDMDQLSLRMGAKWEHFLAYNLECAHDPHHKNSMQALMKSMGVRRIPDRELAKIKIPTALIWGRHDRANRLKIAEWASDRFGWPLYIIEEARDDPKLERPEAFIQSLDQFLHERVAEFK